MRMQQRDGWTYLSGLLGEIGFRGRKPYIIRVDNIAPALLSRRSIYTPRSRNFGVRFHALKHAILAECLQQVKRARGIREKADALTKHLGKIALRRALCPVEIGDLNDSGNPTWI